MNIKCCCVCGKLQKNGKWVDMWIVEPNLFLISHGYCPKHIKEARKNLKELFKKGN